MTRMSKPIGRLTLALYLLATLLASTMGHGLAMAAQKDSYGNHSMMVMPMSEKPMGQDHSDGKDCKHQGLSACGSGHCCYPIPTTLLPRSSGTQIVMPQLLALSFLPEGRLDPPPPKFS